MIILKRNDSDSIGLENHTRTTQYGSTVHFYNIGIGGNNTIRKDEQQGDWVMRKFSTIYVELDGHERRVRDKFELRFLRPATVVHGTRDTLSQGATGAGSTSYWNAFL